MPKTTVKGADKIEKKEGEVSLKTGLEKEKEEVKKEAAENKIEKQEEKKVEKRVEPEKKEKAKTENKQEDEVKAEKSVKPAKEEKKAEFTEKKEKVETKVLPEKVKKMTTGKASPIEEIISQVEKMTVLELSDLVKNLEERFGVVAAAPVLAGTGPAAVSTEEALEKTEWSVILTAVGEKKIQVIKEVRAVTSLGLKEAKTLVEEAPKPVKEGLPQKEAEEIKAKLEAVGATVELK